jgi:acetyl-CoA carboxylase biotin carboxyl carrier protein
MMSMASRIRKLIEILRAEDLDEIEVRTWFTGIRVARRKGASPAHLDVKTPMEEQADLEPEADVSAEEETEAPEPGSAVAGSEEEGLEEILSPMVGTFYRSAGPEMEPFIAEGSRVETGQVLCIIEAMKLMNEIETEKSGVIRKILVEDSQPVEFGQPLFLMDSA